MTRDGSMHIYAALLFALAAGCHDAKSPNEVGVPPYKPLPPGIHVPNPVYSELSVDHVTILRAAVNETLNTITDPSFQTQLEKRSLYAGPDADTPLEGLSIANAYLGAEGHRGQVATQYEAPYFIFWVEPCWGETADTEISVDDPVNRAVTNVRACTFRRASRASGEKREVGEFACAVNTIAHEWAHTVPARQGSNESLFVDNGHANAVGKKDLVSYTIGALAQCIYLDTHGFRVANLWGCVEHVGTAFFDQSTCNDAWAKTLAEPAPTSGDSSRAVNDG